MIDAAAIALLRRNLGDAEGAFEDAELANLLAEQDGSQDRALRQGLWELLAEGSKRWTDYSTDLSQEKKSQIFDHLKALYSMVDERVARASAEGNGGLPPRRTRSVRNVPVW